MAVGISDEPGLDPEFPAEAALRDRVLVDPLAASGSPWLVTGPLPEWEAKRQELTRIHRDSGSLGTKLGLNPLPLLPPGTRTPRPQCTGLSCPVSRGPSDASMARAHSKSLCMGCPRWLGQQSRSQICPRAQSSHGRSPKMQTAPQRGEEAQEKGERYSAKGLPKSAPDPTCLPAPYSHMLLITKLGALCDPQGPASTPLIPLLQEALLDCPEPMASWTC